MFRIRLEMELDKFVGPLEMISKLDRYLMARVFVWCSTVQREPLDQIA
jgi:hypothetical protein